MQLLVVLSYIISVVCFLLAIFRGRFTAANLDLVAAGLFFATTPVMFHQIGLL